MDSLLPIVLILVGISIIVLMVICLKKDKSLAGFYKSINVCGRAYAFFTANFLLVGTVVAPAVIIVGLVQAFSAKDSKNTSGVWITVLALAVTMAAALLLGIFMYRRAAKKSGPKLKRKLLRDMFIIMFATAIRIWLFILLIFVKTWLAVNEPVIYSLPDGSRVYAYPGSDVLYDQNGCFAGRLNSNGTITVHQSTYNT